MNQHEDGHNVDAHSIDIYMRVQHILDIHIQEHVCPTVDCHVWVDLSELLIVAGASIPLDVLNSL